MKFVASSEDGIVVIEAPSEWDARQFACAELGVAEPTVRLVCDLVPMSEARFLELSQGIPSYDGPDLPAIQERLRKADERIARLAHADVDVELRWRGSDAGNHPDRHIETRRAERSGGLRVWGPWRRRVEDSIYHGRLCQADPLPNGGTQ